MLTGVANDPMDSVEIPPVDGPGPENPVSAVWQEFDKSTRSWFGVGTAVDPADEDHEMLLGYVGDEYDAPPIGGYDQGEFGDESESWIWQS